MSRTGPTLLLSFALLTVLVAGVWLSRPTVAGDSPASTGGVPSVGGVPLFATWPKEQTPEVVIVLTGQTFGYMQPCGCSRPQKGGLERRANLLDTLRARGWPVIAADLGDVAAPRKVPQQDWLKYKVTMEAMRTMGYVGVGLGEYDFNQQLYELLSRYTLVKPDVAPIIVAGNITGADGSTTRDSLFPGAGKRPMIEAVEVVAKDIKGTAHLPVGIAGVIGKSVTAKLKAIDAQFGYQDNGDALTAAVKALKTDPRKPAINVLLYAGTKDEATKAAASFQDFQIILCQIEESEPPQFPTVVNDGKTFIIQVGHKGQNAGVVGVFKTTGGYELKYQLVPLGEEFLTPAGRDADNKVLTLLEQYSAEVKKENLLAKFTERPLPHPSQIQYPAANLTYLGSDKCQACHPNEFAVWEKTSHGHAMDALEKLATRPSLRQFDGECVVCHSVGFGNISGYKNEKETANLKHVGCESCHGPGSGHAAAPGDKDLLAALSSWKGAPGDRLPAKTVLEQLANAKLGEPPPVQIPAKQQQIMTGVTTACMKCHDPENDPKFDLNKYMPKIWHSGFKASTAAK